MVDEKTVDETIDAAEETAQHAAETADEVAAVEPQPKKKSKKKWTILGVILGVIVVCGIGMWVWHNDPSFCNNPVCHAPMDSYVQTIYAVDDQPAKDGWGNDVEDAGAMMVVTHAKEGVQCLQCHVPDLSQQMGEVAETLSGNYYLPLEEVDTLQLMENSHHESASGRGDEFCMNDTCHADLTRQDLTQRTADLKFNPHAWHHEQNMCSDCHKSHRASTVLCTQCHSEAKDILPEGWVDSATADQLEQAIYK